MKPLGNQMKRYWRVIGMANAVGVDLVKAHETDRLTDQQWAGMVESCRTCQWDDGCKAFLAQADGDQSVPADCLNAKRFEAMLKTT